MVLEGRQQGVILTSFLACAGCVAVLMHDYAKDHQNSVCFDTNSKWNAATGFAFCVFALFGFNMKRIVLSRLGGYEPIGILERIPGHGIMQLLKYWIRKLGILSHLAAIATGVWYLIEIDGKVAECGNGSLSVANIFAFFGFVANFAIEASFLCYPSAAYMDAKSDKKQTRLKEIQTCTTKWKSHIAHSLTSVVLIVLATMCTMRVEAEVTKTTPGAESFDRASLVTCMFFSIVAAIMLSSDWLASGKWQDSTLLQTHRWTYGVIFVLCMLSVATFAHMCSIGTSHFDGTTYPHRWQINMQFISSILAVGIGPLLSIVLDMAGIPDSFEATEQNADARYELKPPSSGMTYDRLSNGGAKKTELQFV